MRLNFLGRREKYLKSDLNCDGLFISISGIIVTSKASAFDILICCFAKKNYDIVHKT